jgi:hypothetical protein
MNTIPVGRETSSAMTISPGTSTTISPGTSWLFVATDLSCHLVDRADAGVGADAGARAQDRPSHEKAAAPYEFPDRQINGKPYRALTAEYLGWLASRLVIAERADRAGRLDARVLAQLHERFRVVRAWADEHFGTQTVTDIVQKARATGAAAGRPSLPNEPRGVREERARECREPRPAHPNRTSVIVPFAYPEEGSFPFTHPVTFEALACVDDIREEALAVGWTLAGLYQNRGAFPFPYGGDYGLVCFIQPDQVIDQVSREWIALRGSRGALLRFSNRAVPQLWIREAHREAGAAAGRTEDIPVKQR